MYIPVHNVYLSITLFVTADCSQRYGSRGRWTYMAGNFLDYYIETKVEWKRDKELSLKGKRVKAREGKRMKGGKGGRCFMDVTSEWLDVNFNILFRYFFQCGWISPRPHLSVQEPLLYVLPDKVSRQYNSIPGLTWNIFCNLSTWFIVT
jgi:hypothetical protein